MLLKSVLLMMVVLVACAAAAPIRTDPDITFGPCSVSCGNGIMEVFTRNCPKGEEICVLGHAECRKEDCPLTTTPATEAETATEPGSKSILQKLQEPVWQIVIASVAIFLIIICSISQAVTCCLVYRKRKKEIDVEKQDGGDIPVPNAEVVITIAEEETGNSSSAK